MSTTARPPAPPSTVMPASPPRHSRGRRVAIGLAGAAAVVGALLAITGGAVLALLGFDGKATTERQSLSTPTSALVTGAASINTRGFVDALGNARVTIDARADGGRPVFVGVGRAADVERYLAGAATDQVTDFDASPFRSSFSIHRERHAGSAVPAAPGQQRFWIAQGTGRDVATVDWKVRDGDYRVVVMNADGSRGVATQSRVGLDVPYLPWVGLGVLLAGLAVTAGGVASIARRRRS